MSRYWELMLRNGDGQVEAEGVRRREESMFPGSLSSLGMGAESEETAPGGLLRSWGRTEGWRRGEDLQLACLPLGRNGQVSRSWRLP